MGTETRYWTGMEELHNTEESIKTRDNEFTADIPVEEFVANSDTNELSSGRRDFLKFLGFSVGAATLAACETPVTHVIPYVNKPEEIIPGMPNYYASTYYDGYDYGSVIIKTREGRPIFINANKKSNMGAVNARINSSVLGLYDSTRLEGPVTKGGDAISWADADAAINKAIKAGGEVVMLTESIASPSTQAVIDRIGATHIQYDPRSFEGMRKANAGVIPFYDFTEAKVIVSVAADFMNDFPLSAQYTAAYGTRRKPEGTWMSRHFQFEAMMSLTGSNADYRTAILPSQEGKVLASIYNQVTGKGSSNEMADMTADAASALKSARGASLVLTGSNDPNVQRIAAAINYALGSGGKTVRTDKAVNMFNGDASAFNGLLTRMKSGAVKVLMMHGVNPAYDSPMAAEFVAALENVGTSVSFSGHADETAVHASYILPSNHTLESWNDYNVVGGEYALAQPTISPLFDTRQYQDCLLKWSGYTGTYYDFIKDHWTSRLATRQNSQSAIDFWNHSLHNGAVTLGTQRYAAISTGTTAGDGTDDDKKNSVEKVVDLFTKDDDQSAGDGNGTTAGSLASRASTIDLAAALSAVSSAPSGKTELFLYTKMGIGTGSQAANPWLQELPDPITKLCWDNYVTMSPADVAEGGYNMHLGEKLPASLATVEVNGSTLTLPVVPVPGQKSGTVGIALGYGRGANGENIGKAAFQTKEYGGYVEDENGAKVPIGANAYVFAQMVNGTCAYTASGATVTKMVDTYPMAATQTQHTVMERQSVVKETTLGTFSTADSEVYNKPHTLAMHENGETVQKPISEVDLWDQHPIEDIGHWWGLNIDLTTCIGCSACVTACHSENNVPVVGKDEVRRSRDMHWMRIDRYFSSDMTKARAKEEGVGAISMYSQMEIPGDNPSVVHMPMMCQHCNHAPCETVCPVAATTHSSEGLNQMTYNRCIGTRYCANNCPYKVRRFNWFNYKAYPKFAEVNPTQDWVGRLVLNPDVTVRSRGVMEKCSMCVQRIQAGKLEAKIEGAPVVDGAIVTACSDACPTNAISFGDMNDTGSAIAADKKDKRTYMSLEEVGTRPSVSYKVKVRNRDENQA